MKITILSHDLSSNAAMRAHRVACAAQSFADVKMIGPAHEDGVWSALPHESWIDSVPKKRFPEFFTSFLELVEKADGDVLIAVKPHLASYGAALIAAEKRKIPVILDIDDFDLALVPESEWENDPSITDLSRPGSAIYLSLLTRASGRASEVTVSSRTLQHLFGGSILRHGCDTDFFDPRKIDRDSARAFYGFSYPTVLFPGTIRLHKGFPVLAEAVRQIPGVRLAVTCTDQDLLEPEWNEFPIHKLSFVPYSSLTRLLAAADVIAIPQLDTEVGRYQVPMKVFEAMAMAKPVVASAVGDLPEILSDTGVLFPASDVDALRNQLVEVLEHSEWAHGLGEKARIRCVQNYSLAEIGKQLQQVVSRLVPLPVAHPIAKNRYHSAVSVSAPSELLSDVAIPFVARAIDPIEAQRQLEICLQGGMEGPVLNAIRVVKYKPGRRCLLEYDITHQTNGQAEQLTVVGKARKKGSQINHEILESLYAAGFDDSNTDGISIPPPVGYIPEFRMSLQKKVDGVQATKLLERFGGALLAERIAEAIFKLNRCGVASHRHHTLVEEMATLQNRLRTVAQKKPDLSKRIWKLLEACEDLAGTIQERRVRGIHRDFYPDQVVVDSSRIYIVDLDLYSEGEPALDAGNFLGHMTEQWIRQPEKKILLQNHESSFQKKFLELDRESNSSYVEFFKTFTLVRHIYLSTQYPERHPFTEKLLELCENRLVTVAEF